jgi:NAD(P)H-dependent FMN reductase
MSSPSRILAFAGSARRESVNKKLVAIAAAGARDAGASCTLIDLRNYPMPLYDGDLEAEQGLPENALRLKELLASHEGLLLASPEYNGSLPALLKNAFDWSTRSERGTPDLAPIAGKIVGLLAASPGPLGGLRVLGHLRTLLSGLGCWVMPSQFTLRRAHQAFTPEGQLERESDQQQVEALGAELTSWVARMSTGSPVV